MANQLGNFNTPLYAVAALDILMGYLGAPKRVNRRYEEERKAFGRGETVNIRRPSTFTVYDAPLAAGSVDDLATESVAITLNQYKETKFKVTDREIATSTDAVIKEHIRPMAYAHANAIDRAILAQSYLIPHCQQITASSISTPAVLTTADRIMRENGVPDDGPDRRHYAASPTVWAKLLGLTSFTQWQGSGESGVSAQQTASIGQKFGFNPFATNNGLSVAAQTSPTITAGAVNGAHAKGATSVALDATTLTGTLKAGLKISTNRRRGQVSAKVKATGKHAYIAPWLEYGTGAHRIVSRGKGLLFGGMFAKSVEHQGIEPRRFMRTALDSRSGEALLAVGNAIKKRLATKHSLNTADINLELEE